MSPEAVFVFCRFVHFLSLMLLFGQATFIAALTPSSARSGLRERLERAGKLPTYVCMVLMLFSALAIVPIEAAHMGGDGWSTATVPDDWINVLQTAFGQVWRWHLALAVADTALLIVLPQRWRAWAVMTVSAMLLLSLGMLGHAAERDGLEGIAQRTNHALHLLSGGAWLGSLPPLLICLRALRDTTLRTDATRTLRRFSQAGHVAVAVVIGTGVANTAWVVQTWPVHPASTYQMLLDVKILLVALMTGIALFNRYRLVPSMRTAPHASLRALIVGTWCEIVLGGAVLLLVSWFATLDPE